MDPKLTETVIISLTVMVVAGSAALSLAFWAVFRAHATDARMFFTMLIQSTGVRLLAVFWIILTALILALLDILKEQSIIALLSSIAGYVLGGMNSKKQGSHNDEQGGSDA